MKKEELIIDILQKHPSKTASVSELSEALNVSENTIRRYILTLEKQGKIIRYHGGAVLKDNSLKHKDSLFEREKLHTHLKQQIAIKALEYIKDNNIIFVDLGSTCKKLFELLITKSYLTIITPYLDIAPFAKNIHKTTKIIIPGGIYDPVTSGVCGFFTEDFFNNIQPHVSFIGVNGINSTGLSINNVHEIGYKKAVINTSNTTIVLADNSKLNQSGISFVSTFDNIDMIITNNNNDNIPGEITQKIIFA